MSLSSSVVRLRQLRIFFVFAISTTLGVVFVRESQPERHFSRPTIVTDVEVRVVPRLVPTAEDVRRTAFSSENLTAVYRRLKQRDFLSSSAADVAVSEAIGLWRRRIAIEIHTIGDPERRRIRFLAEGFSDAEEAAEIVEAVATNYAGNLSAERWYASVDRLRVAEQACDNAARELLVAVERAKPVADTAERREGPKLLSTDDPTESVRREIAQLVELRSQLTESLQPAHPKMKAIDARLNNLQATAATMSPIRRLSGEMEADFPDHSNLTPIRAEAKVELLSAVSAATSRLVAMRSAVQHELNSMLEPAAAEFPVVTTSALGISLWSSRVSWYALVGLSGLVVSVIVFGWSLAKSRSVVLTDRTRDEESATPQSTARLNDSELGVAGATVSEMPRTESRSDDLLTNVEQVTERIGAPVLAILRRRSQSPSVAPRPSGL